MANIHYNTSTFKNVLENLFLFSLSNSLNAVINKNQTKNRNEFYKLSMKIEADQIPVIIHTKKTILSAQFIKLVLINLDL